MIPYNPIFIDYPVLANQRPSAWGEIPNILKDIMIRFNIKGESAIEFGVEFGYSTSALANYFDKVVGVDVFTGDIHSGNKEDHFETTKGYLLPYKNIELYKDSYQNFILNHNEKYNLAHVDIIHTYEDTFACGDWCIQHSDIVIFHDTVSFKEVYRACEDLSVKHNLEFYNYSNSFGLGILVCK